MKLSQYIFIALFLTPLSVWATPKICVSAFMPAQDPLLQKMLSEAFTEARSAGIDRPDQFVHLEFENPNALKKCLSDNFQNVIMVAHSVTNSIDMTSLLYFRNNTAQGEYIPLSCQFFCHLKQAGLKKSVDIVTCNAENWLANCECAETYLKQTFEKVLIAKGNDQIEGDPTNIKEFKKILIRKIIAQARSKK